MKNLNVGFFCYQEFNQNFNHRNKKWGLKRQHFNIIYKWTCRTDSQIHNIRFQFKIPYRNILLNTLFAFTFSRQIQTLFKKHMHRRLNSYHVLFQRNSLFWGSPYSMSLWNYFKDFHWSITNFKIMIIKKTSARISEHANNTYTSVCYLSHVCWGFLVKNSHMRLKSTNY